MPYIHHFQALQDNTKNALHCSSDQSVKEKHFWDGFQNTGLTINDVTTERYFFFLAASVPCPFQVVCGGTLQSACGQICKLKTHSENR